MRYENSYECSLHQIHQLLIIGDDVEFYLVAADGLEVFAGAGYFGGFDFPEFHGGDISFGLCHEIDMLYASFVEGDGPVGVVFSYGGVDVKAFGEFYVHAYFVAAVQLLGKRFFNRW